jgi:Tol biopolymer transport system component
VHTLVAATAVLVLAQARAQPARVVAAPPDVVRSVARASVSSAGRQANETTFGAVLSASGRHVAFASGATTLVRRDANGHVDVFVRDLAARRTLRASVASSGAESDGPSAKPSISADGSIVAFPSSATNLVGGDANGMQDVFVRDRGAGTTTRISRTGVAEANAGSLAALLSADGRIVVFSSEASNLVADDRNRALDVFAANRATGGVARVSVGPYGESAGRSEASSIDSDGTVVGFRSFAPNLAYGDWNGRADVFVRDRGHGRTERVNVSSGGIEAGKATFRGMVSGDGRFVGFRSRAANLVAHDTNRALDVFVHDRVTGETRRVSVASGGAQADASGLDRRTRRSYFVSRPFLSGDGRYAAFTSRAANLVPGDRNGVSDVFVHDLFTRTTTRVSVSAEGEEANDASSVSGISADGRVVAYTSVAENLVRSDTNRRRDVFAAVLDWHVAGGPH